MGAMLRAGSITGARFPFQGRSAISSPITVEFTELNRMPRFPFPNQRSTTVPLASLLLWLLAIAVVGCGEKEAKPTDPQAKVSGTVTNNGTNVPTDTSVVFYFFPKLIGVVRHRARRLPRVEPPVTWPAVNRALSHD